ncbi:MAG: YbaB/EbfC family nucleoid-associated protein [candidate division WOR-3 bacterium]|nr:MAG: YbaB/EbfC family nucleoid-associated protein [candidate division WOR-3 bacterium]
MVSKVAELRKELDRKLGEIEVEATSGGGMVRVTCNGFGDITGLKIDPEVVKPEEVELLEDLVRAAFNEARSQAREKAQDEMRKLMPFPLPGVLDSLVS